MNLRNAFIYAICMGIVLGYPFASVNAAEMCQEPKSGTVRVPILSPPLGKAVTGKGRLQFYRAPNIACPMNDVFVVPGDSLVAYAETDDGWTSVMFTNSKTGQSPSGWVRSARLKTTGTMGPTQ